MPNLVVPSFARLGKKNHIPVKLDLGAPQQQHQHQRRCNIVLIVKRPATVNVSILGDCPERIDGPIFGLRTDNVGVAHDQNRLLGAVAPKPRDQIRALRVECEEFSLDALLLEHSLKIPCGFAFVAGRIAGICAQQVQEILHRFRSDGLPIHWITVLCVPCERNHCKGGAEYRRCPSVVSRKLPYRCHRVVLLVFC